MYLYSILDKKAGTFGSVLMAPNDAMMCRSLDEMVGQGQTLRRYSEDFDLYVVGEFNDHTGVVSGDPKPVFVVNMAVVFNGKES